MSRFRYGRNPQSYNMLTFAIVIPNFNQSHFLPTALESLKHQTVPFQLAVMDGGSTDNFEQVVRDYSDIITFVRSAPDDGQAAAIKEGKDRVPGDIVSWLNADDYYFPGALDRVASFFESDPDLDIVYGDAVHVTREGFFLSYFPPIQEFNARDLTRSCFICQAACFVRRSAYERAGGIDPTLHYTMDWDLWCRLSLSGAKFQYLHEPLAAARYYRETKTLSSDWQRYKEIWRIERRYGRRCLPLSWAGFYRFDLVFRENKTVFEKLLLQVLDLLRGWKKKMLGFSGSRRELNTLIYGFHRWEPVVKWHCTIHLPWYDRRDWEKLYLKVDPLDSNYRIKLNGEPCKYILSGDRGLVVTLPVLSNGHREISVENREGREWRLLGFWCDLAQNNMG